MFLDGKKSPDVIFLHFDAVDYAGRSTGFSLGNPEQVEAIEKMDNYLIDVLEALEDRKRRFSEEDWLVISGTDHAGRDTGHGGGKDDPARRNIFIIAIQDKLTGTLVEGGNIMDVRQLFSVFLKIKLDQDKQLDGVSLLDY
jgi:predicted AlkP superfamily pyrophosphatase or phosphodiesterase